TLIWTANSRPTVAKSSIASFICETLFDLPGKQSRTAEINAAMSAGGFWDNQERAQELVAELRRLNLSVKPLEELVQAQADLEALMELAEEDDSGESTTELKQVVEQLQTRVDEVELQSTLSGPEDACSAYLCVQAGEGGTDASDWAEMLLRMY